MFSSPPRPASSPLRECLRRAPRKLVGLTLAGRFRLLAYLSSGTFGTAFRARDCRLSRSVILKFLHSANEEEVRKRFEREGRIAARLDHPSLVKVFDLTYIDAVPVLVFEDSGAQPLPPPPLRIDEAVRIARAVLAALAPAHDMGIVHRDIKPEHFLITPTGLVKIIDFGIAKIEGSRLTGLGVALGTPEYMAPEQARGETVDLRADLYAVAAVLFELLTGEGPVEPGIASPLWAVATGNIRRRPRDLRPDVPAWLDLAVARGLAASRADRFATAAEMSAALTD